MAHYRGHRPEQKKVAASIVKDREAPTTRKPRTTATKYSTPVAGGVGDKNTLSYWMTQTRTKASPKGRKNAAYTMLKRQRASTAGSRSTGSLYYEGEKGFVAPSSTSTSDSTDSGVGTGAKVLATIGAGAAGVGVAFGLERRRSLAASVASAKKTKPKTKPTTKPTTKTKTKTKTKPTVTAAEKKVDAARVRRINNPPPGSSSAAEAAKPLRGRPSATDAPSEQGRKIGATRGGLAKFMKLWGFKSR